MSQKPSQPVAWATQNPTNVVQPAQSLVETGFLPGESPSAQVVNALFQNLGNYVSYLDEQSTTTALFTDLAISARLITQAQFSWSISSRTLAWDKTLNIAYPGAQDSANAIAAGSVALNAGDCAYVIANAPFTTVGDTTSGSANVTSILYADQIQTGWLVTGAGIPQNTTVVALGSDGASVTLSNAATATAQGAQLTFAGSGALTMQTSPMASLSISAGTVILARATDDTCYVGVGTGQMRLHDGEQKGLLENGYGDVRRLAAGENLSATQFVYVSQAADNRTAGAVYSTNATNALRSMSLGVNITAQNAGATATIATAGLAGGFSGLTVGQVYYLDPATLGGITAQIPASSGQFIVPVGTAVSSSALLLNPNAAASATPVQTSLTLPGTISGNSIVSAQGFRQQVDMGVLTVGGSGSYPVSNNFMTSGTDSTGTYTAGKMWCGGAGNTGSILNVQVTAVVQGGSLQNGGGNKGWTVTIFQNGNQIGAYTNGFYPEQSGVYAMWYGFTKGQIPFSNFGIINISITGPNQTATRIWLQCTMTIEMSA